MNEIKTYKNQDGYTIPNEIVKIIKKFIADKNGVYTEKIHLFEITEKEMSYLVQYMVNYTFYTSISIKYSYVNSMKRENRIDKILK